MENTRKWTGWILIAAILLITITALGWYTLSSSKTQTPVQSGRTANASVIGYGGPVLVRLTLDEQGKISALDIGGARFAETQGIGSRVRDESYSKTFIGLKPPLTMGTHVDALAGATLSSQAVVGAINEAAAFLQQQTDSFDNN